MSKKIIQNEFITIKIRRQTHAKLERERARESGRRGEVINMADFADMLIEKGIAALQKKKK